MVFTGIADCDAKDVKVIVFPEILNDSFNIKIQVDVLPYVKPSMMLSLFPLDVDDVTILYSKVKDLEDEIKASKKKVVEKEVEKKEGCVYLSATTSKFEPTQNVVWEQQHFCESSLMMKLSDKTTIYVQQEGTYRIDVKLTAYLAHLGKIFSLRVNGVSIASFWSGASNGQYQTGVISEILELKKNDVVQVYHYGSRQGAESQDLNKLLITKF